MREGGTIVKREVPPIRREKGFSALGQNYPDPFNPTTIRLTIVNRQWTIVKLFDPLGREVATLLNEVKDPGTYTLHLDGSHLASGVYCYRRQAGDFVATRMLVLVRDRRTSVVAHT
jgi:hypothetical protein